MEDDDGVVHGVAAVDRLLTLFRTIVPTPYMLCSQVPRAAGTFGRQPAAAARKATGKPKPAGPFTSYLTLISSPLFTAASSVFVSWGT